MNLGSNIRFAAFVVIPRIGTVDRDIGKKSGDSVVTCIIVIRLITGGRPGKLRAGRRRVRNGKVVRCFAPTTGAIGRRTCGTGGRTGRFRASHTAVTGRKVPQWPAACDAIAA